MQDHRFPKIDLNRELSSCHREGSPEKRHKDYREMPLTTYVGEISQQIVKPGANRYLKRFLSLRKTEETRKKTREKNFVTF